MTNNIRWNTLTACILLRILNETLVETHPAALVDVAFKHAARVEPVVTITAGRESLEQVPIWDVIDGARVSYLWIDGLEARFVFIHLEVELGGGDGQGASHHRGRSHQLSAGAQVDGAYRISDMPVRKNQKQTNKRGVRLVKVKLY